MSGLVFLFMVAVAMAAVIYVIVRDEQMGYRKSEHAVCAGPGLN